MTDMMWIYTWWSHTKPLTKKEMEKMKKIMKKVPILKEQNDKYHQKEEKKADQEFENKLNNL